MIRLKEGDALDWQLTVVNGRIVLIERKNRTAVRNDCHQELISIANMDIEYRRCGLLDLYKLIRKTDGIANQPLYLLLLSQRR